MKSTIVKTFVLLGALSLLVPVAGYTATTTEGTSKTAKVKENVKDAAITTKIKAQFAKDKLVKGRKIRVETENGVVKLSGNAASQAEADKAVSIAQDIKDVVSVQNDIQVGSTTSKK